MANSKAKNKVGWQGKSLNRWNEEEEQQESKEDITASHLSTMVATPVIHGVSMIHKSKRTEKFQRQMVDRIIYVKEKWQVISQDKAEHL